MSNGNADEWIFVTDDARSLPAVDILTGRGFVTGKSGSGKSNSASVIAEELLAKNYNVLIIDTEGEYFGLKEQYQLLHVGGDEFADVQIGPEHAAKIAEIGLEKNVPIILDVSGYDEIEVAEELIHDVIEELFAMEKRLRKPFLLMVEEMQEYLPQQGGGGDLGELLERVAKRGRKRGLGICGMSQRPSSVDKDYITQCDWMVWHRLTWNNDLSVVKNVLGDDRAEAIQEFDPGECFLMTDWDDTVERVKFKRKDTHDAGATPGLEQYERPDLKAVGDEIVREIKGDADRSDRIEDLDVEADDGSADSTAEPAQGGDAAAEPTPDAGDNQAPDLDKPAQLFGEQSLPDQDVSATGDITVEYDDEADLVDQLKQARRRNQIYEDEIKELRTILENVGQAPDVSLDSDRLPQEHGPELDPESTAQRRSPPSRPTPPEEPTNREGVGGALLEFGELAVYLMKTFSFKLRMVVYRLRTRST